VAPTICLQFVGNLFFAARCRKGPRLIVIQADTRKQKAEKSSAAQFIDHHLTSKGKTMASRSVKLHRVLRTPPEKVYRAFLEADASAKWLPPYGFTCKVHHMDAKVGGTFRMSFSNFSTGHGHSFGGEYLELVPNELIRYNDKFDDANMPGTMQVTVTLKPVLCGCDISIVQEGIPEMIPLEMCYLGWQESLAQLATLVEPDIPG
jgi:uncharacterized protein YndB with AHSA1/START domain